MQASYRAAPGFKMRSLVGLFPAFFAFFSLLSTADPVFLRGAGRFPPRTEFQALYVAPVAVAMPHGFYVALCPG